MKQQQQRTLRPHVSGSVDSLPFTEVLNMLGRSKATGVLKATTSAGREFEFRFSGGVIVKVAGGMLNDPTLIVRQLGVSSHSFTFRNTAGTPAGSLGLKVDQLLFSVAVAMAA